MPFLHNWEQREKNFTADFYPIEKYGWLEVEENSAKQSSLD